MTVEERARQIIDELFWGVGANPSKETIEKYIVEALRDQIEECAKITDKYEQSEKAESDKFRLKREPIPQATHAIMSVVCERIGKDIRALAAPGEERESEDETTP